MGTTCECLNSFCSLEASDWIDLIGLVANLLLGFWIVRTIQNRLTNKRVLKDHFINEIKDIKNEYRSFLSELYSNKLMPQSTLPWFKLMTIKIDDLLSIISKKYKVDKKALVNYQINLRELITNNDDYIKHYKMDSPIVFSDISRNSFIKFEQENNKIFNDLIVEINDAE